jgi:hypothetical protein
MPIPAPDAELHHPTARPPTMPDHLRGGPPPVIRTLVVLALTAGPVAVGVSTVGPATAAAATVTHATARAGIVAATANATAARIHTTAARAAQPVTSGGPDAEGGTARLRTELDEASRGYLDARNALDRSIRRQRELDRRLLALSAEVDARSRTVGRLAGLAYRSGRWSPVSALLTSGSPGDFLDRAAALSTVAAQEDEALRALLRTGDELRRTRTATEREIRTQRRLIQTMTRRKQQAERALALAGDDGASSGPTATAPSGTPTAQPAPRARDGSWPPESCRLDDPTTSGCLTPRTLHALRQVRVAGFTRYVSCHRDGGAGEHPKGRACDFAAQRGGFGGVATGGDRRYGDQLTRYLLRNADRLGVLYVIWFRQIWLPSSGWRAYHGSGSPAREHTNHVHMSIY